MTFKAGDTGLLPGIAGTALEINATFEIPATGGATTVGVVVRTGPNSRGVTVGCAPPFSPTSTTPVSYLGTPFSLFSLIASFTRQPEISVETKMSTVSL